MQTPSGSCVITHILPGWQVPRCLRTHNLRRQRRCLRLGSFRSSCRHAFNELPELYSLPRPVVLSRPAVEGPSTRQPLRDREAKIGTIRTATTPPRQTTGSVSIFFQGARKLGDVDTGLMRVPGTCLSKHMSPACSALQEIELKQVLTDYFISKSHGMSSCSRLIVSVMSLRYSSS
jgi:hypothetical protein